MAKVTALGMDTITEKSGHQMTGMAVSVCLTPAAPSPLPIPYPTMGTVAEGVIDPCMRTKIEGAKILTMGGCMNACHGNEPGTLKEVVSFNTGGPCFPWLGAPNVFIELGMAGITGSMGQMNKSITVGAGASAGGAGGSGAGGGGAGGPGGGGPQGGSNSGGGGGGSSQGAGPPNPPAPPGADGQAAARHPIDVITGALSTTPTTDFHLSGPLGASWIRMYASSAVEKSCGLGWGWSHSFAWRAERAPNGQYRLIDERGAETSLGLPDDGGTIVLTFGRTITRRGDDLMIELGDGVQRVLRRSDEGAFLLAQVIDAAGHTIDVRWEDGEVARIEDAVGRVAECTRQGWRRSWVLRMRVPDGAEHHRLLVAYELDERGDLVRVMDAGGAEARFTYDAHHYLISERLPDGLTFHFRYETVFGQRRCVETWGDLEGIDLLAALGRASAGRGSGGWSSKGIHHAIVRYGPAEHEARVTDGEGHVHSNLNRKSSTSSSATDPPMRRHSACHAIRNVAQ